jgi:hypothetical protein
MNAPRKYVVSRTLDRPIWRDTTIIRDNVIESVRALKAQPGRNIGTDGSGKRVLPNGVHATFKLTSVKSYPTGVAGLHYAR